LILKQRFIKLMFYRTCINALLISLGFTWFGFIYLCKLTYLLYLAEIVIGISHLTRQVALVLVRSSLFLEFMSILGSNFDISLFRFLIFSICFGSTTLVTRCVELRDVLVARFSTDAEFF